MENEISIIILICSFPSWSVACINWVSRKSGFEKIAIEVVNMQTAKIQLNSGLAKYILGLHGSA